jgi:hypothetical protein
MEGLENIKVSIDLHLNSITGHYIPRLVLNCASHEDWGYTVTLASWSNLSTVTDTARRHLEEKHG